MAKFRVRISNGLVGCDLTWVHEMPDEDADDPQAVEEEIREAVYDRVEWDYDRIDSSKDDG
jgi:hypothetical protein